MTQEWWMEEDAKVVGGPPVAAPGGEEWWAEEGAKLATPLQPEVPGTMLDAVQQMPSPTLPSATEPTPEGSSVLGGLDKIGLKFDEVKASVLEALGDPKAWEKAGKEANQIIPEHYPFKPSITMEGIQGATQLAEAARDPLGWAKNEFQAVRGFHQLGKKVIGDVQSVDKAITDWSLDRKPKVDEALTWKCLRRWHQTFPRLYPMTWFRL